MAPKAAIFVLVFFFLFFSSSTRVSSDAEEYILKGVLAAPNGSRSIAPSPAPAAPNGSRSVAPSPAPAPAPHSRIFVNYEECPVACSARCRLQSRQRLCNRVCMTCCKGCKCVPPGTSGNRELCGTCYTQWTTHGNRTKCP